MLSHMQTHTHSLVEASWPYKEAAAPSVTGPFIAHIGDGDTHFRRFGAILSANSFVN